MAYFQNKLFVTSFSHINKTLNNTNYHNNQLMSNPPKLRKVERDILLPRHLEYKINHELCNKEAKEFAECGEKEGLNVVVDCRKLWKNFQLCTNKYFNDEELKKQVEKEYLEKRAHFRRTGEPLEKSPFKRL